MNRQISVLGIPSDAGTNIDTAPVIDSRNGPAAIRKAFASVIQGYELVNPVLDCGDLDCGSAKDQDRVATLLANLQRQLETYLSEQKQFILLGGAHTLTLGSLRALKAQKRDFSLIYIDAHPDILPEEAIHYGSTLYHAVTEGALDPKRLAYVGIRQIETPELDFIHKHEILYYSPVEVLRNGVQKIIEGIQDRCPPPYYLSIDLDSMDLSYAPGISTPSPFGLNPREVLAIALAFSSSDTIGAEIVELAPVKDDNFRTASLAASLLLQIAQRMTT